MRQFATSYVPKTTITTVPAPPPPLPPARPPVRPVILSPQPVQSPLRVQQDDTGRVLPFAFDIAEQYRRRTSGPVGTSSSAKAGYGIAAAAVTTVAVIALIFAVKGK